MYLSKFQKEIVKKIAKDKIRTVRDFLLEFELLKIVLSRKEQKIVDGVNIIEGDGDFTLFGQHYKVLDRYVVYERLIDFKKVINLLQKAELIEIEKSDDMGLAYLCVEDRPKEAIEIIKFYESKRIIFYNEITRFAKDFLTPQERHERRQLWIPIAFTIATVLISTFINFLTYTKEREVVIKNNESLKDTMYVKIIDDKTKELNIKTDGTRHLK